MTSNKIAFKTWDLWNDYFKDKTNLRSSQILEIIERDINNCDSAYKAGMMQGFRILQSFMTINQQDFFGFMGEGNKINERIESEFKKYKDDNDRAFNERG